MVKTINALFTSVIIKDDSITSALHFNYMEARETMIRILKDNFNIQTDDALIYRSEQEGESTPVFSYRAYLNGEEEPEQPAGKENKNVKIFFSCPRCPSTEGKLQADEDGDIIMECKNCDTPVLVN